ncbi:hypothetical protein Nepgr_022269 [Nepenthes gracilis]|uniref:Uncharacterized protein n=1 Tax=Nepenthes gracilis TaxID=150966 RepID=A0AAD3XWT8_NEPGR|nr:hypothetical protein Nepgr_022269 [Nepenthes gracilis]
MSTRPKYCSTRHIHISSRLINSISASGVLVRKHLGLIYITSEESNSSHKISGNSTIQAKMELGQNTTGTLAARSEATISKLPKDCIHVHISSHSQISLANILAKSVLLGPLHHLGPYHDLGHKPK